MGCIAVACTAPNGAEQVSERAAQALTTTSAKHFAVPGEPQAVGIADLDEDAIPDVVTDAAFLHGLGDGSFDAAVPLPGGAARSLVLIDMNNDGHLDIVRANQSDEGASIDVLLNDGQAAFTRHTVPIGRAIALVAGDFNEDGFPDVAAAQADSQSVQMLFGDGAGALTPTFSSFATLGQPSLHSMAVADLNRDRHLDLILVVGSNAAGGTDALVAFLGLGDGSFSGPRAASSPSPLAGLAVGDIDEDGIPDAVARDVAQGVLVYRGLGTGEFATPVSFPAKGTYADLALADLDLDGHLDIAVAGSPGALSYLAGDGALGFAAAQELAPLKGPFASLAVADLNGDRKPDLVFTDRNLARVTRLLNRQILPIPAPVQLPSVAGPPSVGQSLTCNTGLWSGSPRFTFAWFRGPLPIPGATHATYRVAAEDVAQALSCRVTASNLHGTTTANAAPVAGVSSASASASPNITPPRTSLVLTGSGFAANEPLQFALAGRTLGSATADARGTFGASAITLPASTRPGLNTLLVVGQASQRVATVGFRVETDWPQLGVDGAHTARNGFEARLSGFTASGLRELWSFSSAGGFAASPIIETGTVYIGGKDGSLYALDARRQGRLKWTRSSPDPIDAPAAFANRTVVFASRGGAVLAFDSSGTARWSSHVPGAIRGAPVIANERVVVATSAAGVHALDVQTGVVRWSAAAAGPVLAAPVVAGSRVFVATETGHVHSFNANSGALLWTQQVGAPIAEAPTLAGDVLYVSSVDGRVHALYVTLSGAFRYSAQPSAQALAAPLAAAGALHLGDASGRITWLQAGNALTNGQVQAPGAIRGLVWVNQLVVFATAEGNLGVVTSKGFSLSLLFLKNLADTGLSSPIVSDGTVYSASEAGTVYAYGIGP